MEKIMTVISLVFAAALLVTFCYVVYRRVIKGESADLKKRDEKGKIIK